MDIATDLCSRTMKDFASTRVEHNQFGALVAYPTDKGSQLCEFAIRDLQPELKSSKSWFVSMGSGQLICDPFLGLLRRVFWKEKPPKLNEGIFAVTWALSHAVELNPGEIKDPIHLAILESGSGSASRLDQNQIGEHLENVAAAEAHLATYFENLSGRGQAPPVPDL